MTAPPRKEPFYTLEDIATIWKVDLDTVRQWLNKHELDAVRVNRTVRVTPEAFEDFLKRHPW